MLGSLRVWRSAPVAPWLRAGLCPAATKARTGPALPPNDPARIDVVEFFWYGCPHCYVFEPVIEHWAKQAAADVNFRRDACAVPRQHETHQRMFALEALGLEPRPRPGIFSAIHRQGQMLDSLESQSRFLATAGVDSAKYKAAWQSWAWPRAACRPTQLAEAYDIDGVPSLGVAGRFPHLPSMQNGGEACPERTWPPRRAGGRIPSTPTHRPMKRRDLSALRLAPLADLASAQTRPLKQALHPPRPSFASTPGKIEVVEFFFYLCPHCFAFDPVLEQWLKTLPADVSFRRVPIGTQAQLKLLARPTTGWRPGPTHATHSAVQRHPPRAPGPEHRGQAAGLPLGRIGRDRPGSSRP